MINKYLACLHRSGWLFGERVPDQTHLTCVFLATLHFCCDRIRPKLSNKTPSQSSCRRSTSVSVSLGQSHSRDTSQLFWFEIKIVLKAKERKRPHPQVDVLLAGRVSKLPSSRLLWHHFAKWIGNLFSTEALPAWQVKQVNKPDSEIKYANVRFSCMAAHSYNRLD